MKTFRRLVIAVFALGFVAAHAVEPGAPRDAKKEGEELLARLKLGNQIVRWELSPERLDALLIRPVIFQVERLERDPATEALAKEIRDAFRKVTDKLVASEVLWTEIASRYATDFTREELVELVELVKKPVMAKRDAIRNDLEPMLGLALRRETPAEMKEVARLLALIPRK